MRPAEVALHARRAGAARADDLAWRAARPLWRARWEPRRARALGGAVGTVPNGLLRPDRVNAAVAASPGATEALVAACRPWLEGRVNVLGYENVPLDRAGPALDHDPLSGRPWPARHGRLLDYRGATPGDPKLTWELNRCQELPLLALAWHAGAGEEHGEAAAERLLTWVDTHPPGRGIAWANTFEPGLRALSLAVAFDALRGHPRLAGAGGARVARSLWQHARWISGGLSAHSSANNHLIGELLGLLAVGALVPELREAAAWLRDARTALAREAQLQILADGAGVEQAFAYSLLTTELLLVAVAVLESAGEPAPEQILERLERAADALSLQVERGEPAPAYGDDDSGHVLVLDGSPRLDARHVAATLAARLGHAGARRLAGDLDLAGAILVGSDGIARFAATEPGPPAGDGVLPDGGLVVFRRAGARLLFDVGPLGYLSIAAHGHADALQVDLAVDGHEVVSDPGTGSYFADPTLRRALRGTRAHATVAVDGRDQSEQGGPFLWTRHARARLVRLDLEAGLAVAEHDGYDALEPPASHRRTVAALPVGYLVVDRLSCASTRLYEQTWPLAPELVPTVDDDRIVVARDGAVVLVVHGAGPGELVVAHDGRHSRALESSVPVWTVRRSIRAAGIVEVACLVVPVRAGDHQPATRLALEQGTSSTAIVASVGETRFAFESFSDPSAIRAPLVS